jgi:hypothetical protein
VKHLNRDRKPLTGDEARACNQERTVDSRQAGRADRPVGESISTSGHGSSRDRWPHPGKLIMPPAQLQILDSASPEPSRSPATPVPSPALLLCGPRPTNSKALPSPSLFNFPKSLFLRREHLSPPQSHEATQHPANMLSSFSSFDPGVYVRR